MAAVDRSFMLLPPAPLPCYEVTGVEIPNRVFLGGLPFDATEFELNEFFTKFGCVKDTKIIVDKDSGKPKGYGFVTFETHEEADKVKELGSLYFKQKKINVSKAIRKQGGPQFAGPNSKINQEYVNGVNGLNHVFSRMAVSDPSGRVQHTRPVLSMVPPHSLPMPMPPPELRQPLLAYPPPPPGHPAPQGFMPMVSYTHTRYLATQPLQ